MLTSFVCSKSVDYLVAKAVEEVKPRSSFWWTNFDERSAKNSDYLSSYRLSLKNLLSKVPTKQVNMKNLQPFNEHRKDESLLFNLDFAAPLHFIVIVEDNEKLYIEQLKNALKRIQGSIMYYSVPKFLIVFYQRKQSTDSIKKIFDLVTTSEFANLVILQVIRNKPPIQFYYNHASARIDTQNNSNVKLFPDKMKIPSGYNIRVGVDEPWPKNYKDNEGFPAHLKRRIRLLKVYECFADSLNATSTFIAAHIHKSRKLVMIEKNLEMFLGLSAFITFDYYLRYIYLSDYSKFVSLVPIITETKIIASKNILYSFFTMIGLIMSILLYFKYSRNSSSGWTFINIFKLMLGSSAEVQLQSIGSKIIYSFLLICSIFFVSDLVSNLTKINLVTHQQLLANSVDEILENNIKTSSTIVHPRYLEILANGTSNNVHKLIVNINKVYSNDANVDEIFISTELDVQRALFNYKIKKVENNFEVVDMNLPTFIFAIAFSNKSLLKEKYAEIDTRIRESGIDIKWANELKVNRTDEENIKIDSSNLLIIIPALIGIEFFVGFFVLLLEVAWSRFITYNDLFDYNNNNFLKALIRVLNFRRLSKMMSKAWRNCKRTIQRCWYKVKRTCVSQQ